MPIDIRMEAAKYYDVSSHPYDDIPFYRQRIPSPTAGILELGCGTGRVLIPLTAECGYIHGVDLSEAMITLCRGKMTAAGLSPDRACVEVGDITDLDLGRAFDLITAPFRVMQNLATDMEVDGLFRSIHRHLAPGGTAILNVFRPLLDREGMLTQWCREEEQTDSEIQIDGGRLVRSHTRRKINADPLVCYPELIYRFYEGETLVEEAILPIAMRCYYPDEYVQLIEGHGFRVTGKWGGYADEPYGEGGELVVAFTRAS